MSDLAAAQFGFRTIFGFSVPAGPGGDRAAVLDGETCSR